MEGLRRHRHLNYANVTASLALIVAIAGGTTAIAVSKSTKSDVNKKGNIRAGRVTTPKLQDGAVTAQKLAGGNITAGQLAGVHLVEATGSPSASVTCPSGERLLSGGAVPVAGGLDTSFPETPNSWRASGAGGVRVIAICLKNTPGA